MAFTVSISAATLISEFSAQLNGTVVNGDLTAVSITFVWGRSNPPNERQYTFPAAFGAGTSNFSFVIGVGAATQYFFRASGINSTSGTIFSSVSVFTTPLWSMSDASTGSTARGAGYASGENTDASKVSRGAEWGVPCCPPSVLGSPISNSQIPYYGVDAQNMNIILRHTTSTNSTTNWTFTTPGRAVYAGTETPSSSTGFSWFFGSPPIIGTKPDNVGVTPLPTESWYYARGLWTFYVSTFINPLLSNEFNVAGVDYYFNLLAIPRRSFSLAGDRRQVFGASRINPGTDSRTVVAELRTSCFWDIQVQLGAYGDFFGHGFPDNTNAFGVTLAAIRKAS